MKIRMILLNFLTRKQENRPSLSLINSVGSNVILGPIGIIDEVGNPFVVEAEIDWFIPPIKSYIGNDLC